MSIYQVAELSWKPLRSDERYCAPACGRGCTFVEYESAKAIADAIVAELGGAWLPRVTENLGWFGSAWTGGDYSESVRVYPYDSGGKGYWATFLTWSADGETPTDALRGLIEKARGEVAALREALSVIEGSFVTQAVAVSE